QHPLGAVFHHRDHDRAGERALALAAERRRDVQTFNSPLGASTPSRAAAAPAGKHLATDADANRAQSRIGGTMNVLPSLVSASSTATVFDCVTCREISPPVGSLCRWADQHGKALSATVRLSGE